jgi:hypothetical protein
MAELERFVIDETDNLFFFGSWAPRADLWAGILIMARAEDSATVWTRALTARVAVQPMKTEEEERG